MEASDLASLIEQCLFDESSSHVGGGGDHVDDSAQRDSLDDDLLGSLVHHFLRDKLDPSGRRFIPKSTRIPLVPGDELKLGVVLEPIEVEGVHGDLLDLFRFFNRQKTAHLTCASSRRWSNEPDVSR